MKFLNLTIILLSAFLLQGCIKEDKFGLSSFKEIKAFEIPGQAGGTAINKDERSIVVPMGEDADITQLAPSLIEISNLATVSPGQGEVRDFTEPVIYTVTAEDDSRAEWTVTVVPAVPNPQLLNSNK
jgi:hypothetical protein